MVGKNQKAILDLMEEGKEYTTTDIAKEVFRSLPYSSHTTIHSALTRLEIRRFVKSRFVDKPIIRNRRGKLANRPRKQIRMWRLAGKSECDD